MKVKKRFIAGAICPACAKEDTLRWWIDAHIEVIECVACGHRDSRLPTDSKSSRESNQSDPSLIGFFKPS